jgi:hypothetical protein
LGNPVPKNNPKSEPSPKRKKRWRKVLGILSLLLIGLALYVNGPGARWFLHKTIVEQLAERGLQGETTVAGRLSSGFTLSKTSFTGSGPLRTFKAEQLTVQYRIKELLNKKIDRVQVRGVHVILQPEPSEKEDKDWRDTFDSLRKFHPLVDPVEFDLTDISIVLEQEGKEAREFSLGKLTHAPLSGTYSLEALSPGLILAEPSPTQDCLLTWEEAALKLDQFTIAPKLQVSELALNYGIGNQITAETNVQFHGATLSIDAREDGAAKVELTNGPLDLSHLNELLTLPHPLTGTITQLDLDSTGLLGPPTDWVGSGIFATKEITWDEHPIPDLTLDLTLSSTGFAAQSNVADGVLTLSIETPPPPLAEKKKWWIHLPITASLKCSSLASAAELYQEATGKSLPEALPKGIIETTGTLSLGSENPIQEANFDWQGTDLTLKDQPLPALEGTFAMEGKLLSFSTNRTTNPTDEELSAKGSFDLAKKTYEGNSIIKLTDSAWLSKHLPSTQDSWAPTGPLSLQWEGKGNIEESTHQGSYAVETLTIKTPDDTLTNASTKGSYQWPESVTVESIAIRNGELELAGGVHWTPERCAFKELKLEDGDGVLAILNGTGPGGPSLKDLLDAKTPFDLQLKADELKLARLRKLLPITFDPGYQATFNGDLKFTGTADHPALNGNFSASGILTSNEKIPPLTASTTFTTVDGKLSLTGAIAEPAGELATLSAALPVELRKWADDPALLKELPLSASININDLPLTRLQAFAPVLKEAEGAINVDLQIAGTPSKPRFEGTAGLEIKSFPLPNTPHQAIRDTTLLVNFDKERITLQPSSCTIAGGTISLSGHAELTGESPVLDFQLDASNALLWRNELLVSRTSGQLKLSGPWETATLSGELGIVESLIYKDIEIIPLRADTSAATPPKLPQFSKKTGALSFDLPAPLNEWPLNVRIFTQDPFLLRGNLATGQATGDFSITGTFAKPLPKGAITIEDMEVILPFSTLNIKKGTILIRPEDPRQPILDLRGRSVVNSTKINLHVFGPISDPKYHVSSDPPMTKSDIIALLATGASTADLEDPALAQMRLFQLVVDKARRKANAADSGRVMKLFRGPLNAIQDLNLRVAENDPFSGRKFSSASLELSDKWTGVVQFDDEGNTRGLLRYSLRFK